MSKYHGYTKEQFRTACHNRLGCHGLDDFITTNPAYDVDADVSFLANKCQVINKSVTFLFDALINNKTGHFDEWLLMWMANASEVKDWGEF